jgi:Fe-Mn family superoxide dismutase
VGGAGQKPSGRILKLIEENFNSYPEWEKRFRGVGKSARGWAVLSFDYRDNKLHNYLLDAHDEGNTEETWPLLVLDVYEHAYMIDYGINREAYIDVFFKNINWNVVNKRALRALEIKNVLEGKGSGSSAVYYIN